MPKLIKEELKYEGKRFNVIQKTWEDENKKIYIRDGIDTAPASIILPITENNEVIFVKQYREIIGEQTLELPAGIIENGEEPIDAAKRELEEETGFKAKIIEPLIDIYPSCGYTNEKFYLFFAKNLEKGKMRLDDDEHITEVVKIPLKECIELVKKNFFKHASQNIAIMLYYIKYNNL